VNEVVTYDDARVREYTNARLVNDWPATGAPIGQGQQMAVVSWPQFGGYNFVRAIDEFQIFGWCLSADEIQAMYDQRK
jgi:hypothetical protein